MTTFEETLAFLDGENDLHLITALLRPFVEQGERFEPGTEYDLPNQENSGAADPEEYQRLYDEAATIIAQLGGIPIGPGQVYAVVVDPTTTSDEVWPSLLKRCDALSDVAADANQLGIPYGQVWCASTTYTDEHQKLVEGLREALGTERVWVLAQDGTGWADA